MTITNMKQLEMIYYIKKLPIMYEKKIIGYKQIQLHILYIITLSYKL